MKKLKKKLKRNAPRVIPVPKALVLRETSLSERQNTAIAAVTPPMFVKTKPGRGGKQVSYVEAGYVISRLNTTFSPVGWDFEIVAQGESQRKTEGKTEGEVWVRGKLTIIDHKAGYRVSKTQYGQHPIHEKIPIGDAYKAAASDCLKKCASMFGIAHDVYWGISETEGDEPVKQTKEKKTSVDSRDMQKIEAIIRSTRSVDMLMQVDKKIHESPIYTVEQKKLLHGIISAKVDDIDSNQA